MAQAFQSDAFQNSAFQILTGDAFQDTAFQNNAFQTTPSVIITGTAFQCNAFQLSAFQTTDCEPEADTSRDPGVYVSGYVYARRFRFMR